MIEIQPANPEVVYVPYYDPAYIWGPPLYGYYPAWDYPYFGFGFGFGPGIYIGGFSGAFIGVVGGGGQTGIIARSIRTITFSIITVTADTDIDMALPGLTIPAIGRESTIRIVRSINATAEFQWREADRVSRGLAGNHMRLGSTNTVPRGQCGASQQLAHILASRGSPAKVRNAATALLRPIMEAADTARVLPTAEATAETVPCPSYRFSPSYGSSSGYRASPSYSGGYGRKPFRIPAIASARPMAAAADTARVLPTAELRRKPFRSQLSLQPVIRRRRRIPVRPFF